MDAGITPKQLFEQRSKTRARGSAPLIIDVRRDAVFRAASDRIAGAMRRDPATVAEWSDQLAAGSHVVVYCVHGHEVSQNVARVLQARGLAAQFLEGGLEAWRASGGAVEANNNAAGENR